MTISIAACGEQQGIRTAIRLPMSGRDRNRSRTSVDTCTAAPCRGRGGDRPQRSLSAHAARSIGSFLCGRGVRHRCSHFRIGQRYRASLISRRSRPPWVFDCRRQRCKPLIVPPRRSCSIRGRLLGRPGFEKDLGGSAGAWRARPAKDRGAVRGQCFNCAADIEGSKLTTMNEKKSTYRVEIKNIGTPPNEAFGWNIYRNQDVLPILRSQQLFVSRAAGLADANRSRLQLIDADVLGRAPQSIRHF